MRQLVNWQDHVVQYPDRYRDTDLGGGMHQHVKAPGEIIQQGTPMSAANFNNMDHGILEATLAESIILQHMLNKERAVDAHLEKLDDETAPEIGTVTLTNTAKQPFNNSVKTVAFAKTKKNPNYIVECVVTNITGGCLGDVHISDKALNGFKVSFDGSAKSVTLKYIAKGGMFS